MSIPELDSAASSTPLSALARAAVPSACPRALQEEFDAMCGTFAPSGGMLHADVLAARSGLRGGNGIGIVARWIVGRRVVSIHWRGVYWVPAFQFSTPPMRLQEGMADVLVELCPVMDDWCLAQWFSSANGWLAGACPADALKTAPGDVWHAARAKRFAICG